MSQLINKKDTLTLILQTFTNIYNKLNNFKIEVTNLKASIDTIDLTDPVINAQFANDYDDSLEQFINDIITILFTRKDIIKDDGSLVINPIDSYKNIYQTEIWCSNITDMIKYKRYFPARIICKYDNISVDPDTVTDTTSIQIYTFYISDKVFTIFTSLLLDLDSFPYDLIALRNAVKAKLDEVLENLSFIQDCCKKNMTIINYSIQDFSRIYGV